MKTKVFGTRNSVALLLLLAVLLPMFLIVMVQRQVYKQEAVAKTHAVSIVNYNMSPVALTVHTGDTVTWTNQDADAHDVHSTTEDFKSPLLQKGESWSFTFTKEGTFEYYCTPHKSFMKGYTITVVPAPLETATPVPQATQAPTTTPTSVPPSVTPTLVPGVPTIPPAQPTAVPPPTDGSSSVNIILSLPGIGQAGDIANPSANDMSNKSPKTPERLLSLILVDSTGKIVQQPSGTVVYSPANGDFRGTIDLGSKFTPGKYMVKVLMQKYLMKIIASNFSINVNASNTIPAAQLVAGDIDSNNLLDVTDYNLLLTCLDKESAPSPCQGKELTLVDLNDDGVVTLTDTNLFLREFSVRGGD